jgi:hypothetical protein
VGLSDAAFAVYEILREIVGGAWVNPAVPSSQTLSFPPSP